MTRSLPVRSQFVGALPVATPMTRAARFAAATALAAFSMVATSLVPQGALASDAIVAVGQGDVLQRVDLGVNKSLVIDLPSDAFDILVANPAIADAVTRSSRRIYLFGKQVGSTNIFVFGSDGEPIANLELSVKRDIGTLEADLERFVPGSDIQVEVVNDKVILSGAVLTAQDANRAAELATTFLDFSNNAAPGSGETTERAVVNLLTILGEDQVTLKLTVAEVQRSIVKQLGISLSGGLQTGTFGDDIGFGALTGGASLAGDTSQGRFTAGGQIGAGDFGIQLQATLNALNRNGVVRTLAEPVLTAISGESANFRAGGALQVLQSITFDERGRAVREYEEIQYGVSMAFRPVVLSSGRISIKLQTEVSEPVPSGDDSGITLFSLRERTAETTVEVPSGGSFMIAGLISDSTRQNIAETPGLSRIPIFGALFRSREFVREETELVIIATPYLVRPVARQQLAKPDDNFQPANDTKGFLLGRINKIYGNRKSPDGPYHGAVGFIYK